METDFEFRRNAVRTLPTNTGVYILADLDNIPIYVGQSADGIRSRVARHLTSARSDIIANRQIDVWEIAFVWTYPVLDPAIIKKVEARLFHHFNSKSQLMNGIIFSELDMGEDNEIPEPESVIKVMPDAEIEYKKNLNQRLPRQISQYEKIVEHFLTVKKSTQIERAMHTHFERMQKYHLLMLGKDYQVENDEI